MKNINVTKFLASFAFGLFALAAVPGCAADTKEPSNDPSGDGDSDTTESDLGAGVGACKALATFQAQGRRVCTAQGKQPVFGRPNRTYVDHGTSKTCPGGEAVSQSYQCR